MPRRLRHQTAGDVLHITARGVDGFAFARDENDRNEFACELAGVVHRHGLHVLACCLMPNHYHLLLALDAPVGPAMASLNSRFARRFNLRHERSGPVFGQRYHAARVERDQHLAESVRYIVLNPVRAGLCRGPANWRWSSYRASAGVERSPFALADDWLVETFGANRNRFRAFVRDGA
jgi:putative transposase